MVHHLTEFAERNNALILARWHSPDKFGHLDEVAICYAKVKEEFIIDKSQYKATFRVQCFYELEISDFLNPEKAFYHLGVKPEYKLYNCYTSIIHRFNLDESGLSYYDKTPIVYLFKIHALDKPKYFQLTDNGFQYHTSFYTMLSGSAGFTDDFFEKIFSVDMSKYISSKIKDINNLRIKTRD